ncbi:MAG TPA: DNA repair protein RecO [Verrucomicrobiae bacterium]|nr:DNA repair protein RecO [Verrucomicrobiae bacterium]
MIQSATGIVLRTRPLTDTSLIVNWLTRDLGRVSTAAKGARGNKSLFRGKLDLFYEADFSYTPSRRSDLHALREVNLRETHAPLRQEIRHLQQAAYAAALIEQTTEKETPLPAIYELMHQFLAMLPQRPPQPRSVFAFELKLLADLGLNPDLAQTHLTEATKGLVHALLESDWPEIYTLKPTAPQANELRHFLHGYLIFHLGKIPKQRAGAIHA